MRRLPAVPASFFSIVLGLAGLGGEWREASRAWGLPMFVGQCLLAAAAVVWSVLLFLYLAKWAQSRAIALDETRHPVQCCFIGLIGVSTMLLAGAALPYARPLAIGLFGAGALFTLGFALWRTGVLWEGGRDQASTTAVLYLPTVAGSFVAATVASALESPAWAQLAFGSGLFSWLAIESVLLGRLYNAAPLPPALRPTLGIQLAPPTVGLVAYLSITGGHGDMFAYGLLGYGLLQALVLARLSGWIWEHPFAANYWGISFGATAIGTGPLLMLVHGDGGPAALLAPWIFTLSNLLIGTLILGTLKLMWDGKLLPPSTTPTPG